VQNREHWGRDEPALVGQRLVDAGGTDQLTAAQTAARANLWRGG
jgi:hypothetical protein